MEDSKKKVPTLSLRKSTLRLLNVRTSIRTGDNKTGKSDACTVKTCIKTSALLGMG